MFGNTKLVPYGIQTEDSDLRIHVCPVVGLLYMFPTKNVLPLLKGDKYPTKPAYQKYGHYSIETAQGYLIPPDDIPGCMSIKPPIPNWGTFFRRNQSTSEKGQLATGLVQSFINMGEIPIALNVTAVNDIKMQISGTDIWVTSNIKIQVKCDFNGGYKELGGTGNLYIQVAECNPFGHK